MTSNTRTVVVLVLQGHLVLPFTADAMPEAPGSAKTPAQTSMLLLSETLSHNEEVVTGFSTCSEAASVPGTGKYREPNTYLVAALSSPPESDSRVGGIPNASTGT